jgi:23S rRNA (cytidine1920-2'-O)/16S rRNA (cytidine1409-2'-O)-methyltransferase
LKERLDVLLVKKGYFDSREKARRSIMAGVVFVGNSREDKPGARFDENTQFVIKENTNPYVSRGGLKLDKAIKEFNISLEGKAAIDIGASTGGFTDCMLKNGARKVFAVDVGYGQLAWELRNDHRVVNMERTNIRNVRPEDLDEKVDFCSIDVSFISLKKVIPPALNLAKDGAEFVCLIKPQFEAGRDQVGKRGVVKKAEIHKKVVTSIAAFVEEKGLNIKGLSYSPIKGPEGNIEYLIYFSKKECINDILDIEAEINRVIMESHKNLK